MKLTIRDFLKSTILCAAVTLAVRNVLAKEDLQKVFTIAKEDYWHIAWLSGATCSGCAVSFAQAADPDVIEILTSITVGKSGLPIALPDYMQVLHPASGSLAGKLYKEVWKKATPGKRILIVEGAVQEKGYCEVVIDGEEMDFGEWLKDAAEAADAVIAFGSCAAFGGIPRAHPNPTGAMGVMDFFKKEGIKKTVINLPRCPGHPDSLVQTIVAVIVSKEAGIPLEKLVKLDKYNRPIAFYGMNMHDARCAYRPYYDRRIFIQQPGAYPEGPAEEGCRYKIGCKGPIAYTDCGIRKWNNHVSYCVEVGAPCIGCSEPEFPDPPTSPFYRVASYIGRTSRSMGEAIVDAAAIECAAHFIKRKVTKKEEDE